MFLNFSNSYKKKSTLFLLFSETKRKIGERKMNRKPISKKGLYNGVNNDTILLPTIIEEILKLFFILCFDCNFIF